MAGRMFFRTLHGALVIYQRHEWRSCLCAWRWVLSNWAIYKAAATAAQQIIFFSLSAPLALILMMIVCRFCWTTPLTLGGERDWDKTRGRYALGWIDSTPRYAPPTPYYRYFVALDLRHNCCSPPPPRRCRCWLSLLVPCVQHTSAKEHATHRFFQFPLQLFHSSSAEYVLRSALLSLKNCLLIVISTPANFLVGWHP